MLEQLGLPLGVVLGTKGVERHAITFHGQEAHSGATPMKATARRAGWCREAGASEIQATLRANIRMRCVLWEV